MQTVYHLAATATGQAGVAGKQAGVAGKHAGVTSTPLPTAALVPVTPLATRPAPTVNRPSLG